MIKASIIGGSGYTGGELIRLLLGHPNVEIVAVTSRSHTGKPISDLHPNLLGFTNLVFVEENLPALAEQSDVMFFALPHGEAMGRIASVIDKVKVIDLGGDFRMKDVTTFEKFYKIPHTASELLPGSVYGLPELNRDQIKDAQLVACPGCFPTGAILALYPLAKAGLLDGAPIIIDSKTGSSGSGATPSETTHHPERFADFKAYGLFTHRHQPEISEALNSKANGASLDITFAAHSAPMVRGIFTSAYAILDRQITTAELNEIYCQQYEHERFIRIVKQARSAVVAHTNFCDISLTAQGRKVIINTAIDNLVKGASGQAVQNLNLMFGFPETTALLFPGTHP